MQKRGNVVVGTVFIILGGLFLFRKLGLFDFNFDMFNIGFIVSRFWPLIFLIMPGLIFHLSFFSGKNRDAGLLVPGGILLVLGLTFQANMILGLWHITWPFYIMAVAIGLFELYVFGGRDRGLLIPVGILGGLSVIFLMGISFRWVFDITAKRLFFPIALIVVGLIVLFRGKVKKNF